MSSDWSQLLEWRARKEHASSSDAELVYWAQHHTCELCDCPQVTELLSHRGWLLERSVLCWVLVWLQKFMDLAVVLQWCQPHMELSLAGAGSTGPQCDPCLSGWDLDNCPVYATTLHTIIVDSSLWYDNDCPVSWAPPYTTPSLVPAWYCIQIWSTVIIHWLFSVAFIFTDQWLGT